MGDHTASRLSAAEAARRIRDGQLGPTALVDAALERIREHDDVVGAYVTVFEDEARAEAEACEREVSSGGLRGPLHGVPVAIKDLADMAGTPTSASSRVREGHVATADAPVVARLRAAGAIVVGKTHTHEFAYGPICPATRNAWDVGRIAGGSSGGSAVAVALDMATAAIGTDTGGSIRIPSALNGLVGLKPTYGRVPKSGVTPLGWSLDHVGPMTRTVEDAALLLSVMAGRDRSDPTSAREPVGDYAAALAQGVRGLRVGVPTSYFLDAIEPDVLAAFEAAVDRLVELGVERVDVRMEDVEHSPAALMGILLPEASAYHQEELRTFADRYGDDVRTLLELGEAALGTHYVNAQRVRARIKDGARRCFEDAGLDALLVPPVPLTAPPVGQETVRLGPEEQTIMAALVDACAPFNLTGQPLLTVPCGLSADGLPIGLGIVGRPFDEAMVLRIGAAYERATEWGTAVPGLAGARQQAGRS